MTDTEFYDVVYSDTTLDQISTVTTGESGITMFKAEVSTIEVNTSSPNVWHATKLQPWPAAAWSDMYRFEKGDEAVGYVHNKLGSSNKLRWKDERMALNSSLSSVSLSLVALIGSAVSLLAF